MMMWTVDGVSNDESSVFEQEQKQRVLAKAKSLLNWQEEMIATETERLDFAYDLMLTMVKAYCHFELAPEFLEPVLTAMTVDVYRGGDWQSQTCDYPVKSISRGDVSISYQVDAGGQAVLLRDYGSQLASCRRMPW